MRSSGEGGGSPAGFAPLRAHRVRRNDRRGRRRLRGQRRGGHLLAKTSPSASSRSDRAAGQPRDQHRNGAQLRVVDQHDGERSTADHLKEYTPPVTPNQAPAWPPRPSTTRRSSASSGPRSPVSPRPPTRSSPRPGCPPSARRPPTRRSPRTAGTPSTGCSATTPRRARPPRSTSRTPSLPERRLRHRRRLGVRRGPRRHRRRRTSATRGRHRHHPGRQTDFVATVTKVRDSGADTVFFGGYYAEAGLFIRQLRDGGFKGTFVVADGVKDPGYIDGGGRGRRGHHHHLPVRPGRRSRSRRVRRRLQGGVRRGPGTYAAEAYDAANIFLDGIAEGITNREDDARVRQRTTTRPA